MIKAELPAKHSAGSSAYFVSYHKRDHIDPVQKLMNYTGSQISEHSIFAFSPLAPALGAPLPGLLLP